MNSTNRNDTTPDSSGAARGWGARLKVWSETATGRLTIRILKVGLTGLIVLLLALQLYRIGWRQVVSELPTDPRFYGILLLLYVNLPLVEALVYQRILNIPYRRLAPALFKKRVLNRDLVEYAGEVSFFSWVRRASGLPQRRVFHVIKDNVIASAIASIVYALTFLGVAVALGVIPLPTSLSTTAPRAAVVAVVVAGIATILYRYRHRVFVLSTYTLVGIAALHFFRLAAVSALQVLQWYIVLPNVPLSQLVTIHAIQVIAHRIPFLPSRDLVFVGASIELARVMEMSMAEMAGVLVAATAIEKVLNLVLFGWITATENSRLNPAEPS